MTFVSGFYYFLLFHHFLIEINSDPTVTNSSSDSLEFILTSEKTPTKAPTKSTKIGYGITTPSFEDAKYQSDCSEPMNKDISCSIHIVDCADQIFDNVEDGKEPPGAHDVRIAPIAKVLGANRIDRREHRLHVDVSWQMPHHETAKYLKAFKLHVSGPNNKNTCFVFNVTHHEHENNNNNNEDDDTVSPRYRFSSNSLFEFSSNYTITIFSLPKSATKYSQVSAKAEMPDDPDTAPKDSKNLDEYCKTHTNTQASKWAASFRKIFLFSVVQMIQIEFLAAPPQYCFEEYEVRLLDSSGIVMLQSAIIKRSDLKTEIINGKPVQFGEHNFTNIELDTDLIPSVIPIETSNDGRCLCETENGCSCLAADWKPVKLSKIEKPINTNRTINNLEEKSFNSKNESNWHIYALFVSLALLFLFCICVFCMMSFYRRYEKRQKSIDVRFINDNPTYSNNGVVPLILKQSISVLILYSHDCVQHEAAVIAFSELLRDVFNMNVHLDVWDDDEIESNQAEYINSSIVRADKVIIVNSIGSYYRVSARQLRETPLERIVPGQYDNLFLNQIDFALQHVRIISVRFSYTPSKYTLFALSPLLQFTIPDNLSLLTSSLTDSSARNYRLDGFSGELSKLQAAISRMSHYIECEPKWFERTHHRVISIPRKNDYLCSKLVDVPIKATAVSPSHTRISSTLSDNIGLKPEEAYLGSEEEATFSATVVDIINDHDEEEEDDDDNGSTSIGEEQIGLLENQQPQMIINSGNDIDDSGILDSAYISGSDFSTQSDVHMILDNHRLNSNNDCDYQSKNQKNRDVTVDSAFHDDVIGVI